MCRFGINGSPYYLHGITSWSYDCALPYLPSVFVRVSPVLGWIQNTMEVNNNNNGDDENEHHNDFK